MKYILWGRRARARPRSRRAPGVRKRRHGAPPGFVPVSARFGDLILQPGNRIDWYDGPTLAEGLQLCESLAA